MLHDVKITLTPAQLRYIIKEAYDEGKNDGEAGLGDGVRDRYLSDQLGFLLFGDSYLDFGRGDK